jgi:Zn-dependent protease
MNSGHDTPFRSKTGAFIAPMRGAKTLFTLRNIPIRVHFTLGLAFVFLVSQWGLWGIPGGLILFASVLAHELGHAAVAQRLGITIGGIDLHLLGGTAVMNEHPSKPADEIMIAAAGPLVSLALALVFGAAVWLMGTNFSLDLSSLAGVLAFTSAVNFMLGVFNLIPALPMDGGRIFRGLLARKLGAQRATQIAAKVARVIAVALGLFGILSLNLSLTLIALFIYFLSKREEHVVNLRASSSRWAETWEAKMGSRMDGYVIDVSPEYIRR